MSEGWIYFIQQQQAGNPQEDPIKVGWSTDAGARALTLQTGSPFPLEILAIIPGSLKTEKGLHRLLAPHKIKGEWFTPCPELLQIIETRELPSLPSRQKTRDKKRISVQLMPHEEWILEKAHESAAARSLSLRAWALDLFRSRIEKDKAVLEEIARSKHKLAREKQP